MSSPYLYTDPDGDTLEVVPVRGTDEIRLVAADEMDGHRTCVTVEASALNGLVAAMYKAAGLPAPLVLERTEADDWARVAGMAGAA